MRTTRPSRPLLALLAAGLLGGGLAACGGADGAAGDGGATERPDDEKELAFARCMREAGIDLPDPGSGPVRVRIPRNVSPAKLQASMQACRKKTGGGPREPTEEERTEMRDAALKFARCMRSQGIDMPDPQAGGGPGGGGMLLRRGAEADTPAFRKALEACEDALPLRRRFGGSGGGEAGSAQSEAE